MPEGATNATVASLSLKRGSTIGRYVVISLVGRGAMGEVYAAYDPELDRKVAVKLLQADGLGRGTAAEAKARLLREAQAIARLSHPNVIVVHDVGSVDDRVFIAMEFVDGNTVGYWLQASKRPWREVLRVFTAAGEGLAAAHASHLVHRDFKLENVMLGRDGKVRVMDFGLARHEKPRNGDTTSGPNNTAAGPNDAAAAPIAALVWNVSESTDVDATRIVPPPDEPLPAGRPSGAGRISESPAPFAAAMVTELTQSGTMMGTPAYMAPEQFLGQQADARSDQFSFCVALYEGLYGQRPFAGETVKALSDNVLGSNVLPAPEDIAVPGWIRRVVLRGLRRNPTERWPSMDDLLRALAQDPSIKRRRVTLAALALSAVVAGGVAVRHQMDSARRPSCHVPAERFSGVWEPGPGETGRRATIAAAFRASGKAYAADAFSGVARLLDRYVKGWSAMYTDACEATNVRGEQSAEVLDLRMSCLHDRWSEVRALSDVLAQADGEMVSNAVKATASLSSLDGCADVRALRESLPPPGDPKTRQVVDSLRGRLAAAKALSDAGKLNDSLASLATLVAEARGVAYKPVLAEALTRLGIVQVRLRRATEGEKTLDEAIWVGTASRYDELVAEASINQIYTVGYLQRDFARADRWIHQAEAYVDRLGGHDLLRAWMENNIGTVLDTRGEVDQAAIRYRRALTIKERVLGPNHPDVANSLNNLALTLSSTNRNEEALEMFNRGIDIIGETLGWQHIDMALQLANRAELLNQLGRYADGRRDAARAVAIYEREVGANNPELQFVLELLGEAELGLERPELAIAPLERAMEMVASRANDVLSVEERKTALDLARALWNGAGDRQRAKDLAGLAARPPVGGQAAEGELPVIAAARAWNNEHTIEVATVRHKSR